MEHFLTTIIGSLALVAGVFVIATLLSAVLSKPSKAGHLSPYLSPAFRSFVFVVCIVVFPFLASLTYLYYHRDELTDTFLINAVVIFTIWNICNTNVSDTARDSEVSDGG